MTNLTDKWIKGELPYGRYYVELAYNGNNIIMAEYWWDKALMLDDHEYSREEVKRILAPVPSYDEYQKLLADQLAKNEGVEINAELEAENTKLKTENKWYSEQLNEAVKKIGQLKELLTMAREVLKMVDTYSGDYDSINGFLIVEKIDKVLGEE